MIIKILIFLTIIWFLYKYFIYESYSTNLYLNKYELEKHLINDSDNYYKNFNLLDYKVRNINTLDDYYIKIKNSCRSINNTFSQLLDKAIEIANNKIKKYKCEGFDGLKASNIQWTIGLIDGNEYEGGLPHTRNNIIILPTFIITKKSQLIKTLVHEKIHIYQKIFLNDLQKYLNKNGFTKYLLKNNFNNIRANPDLDNWVYKNKENQIMIAKYLNNCKTIFDINIYPINKYINEHPFEFMAYDLQDKIMKL